MPRYDYACNACGQVTEATRPVDERDEPLPCSCNAGTATRQFAPQSILIADTPRWFHTSGWNLPDKSDKAAWAKIGSRSETCHKPDHSFSAWVHQQGLD